MRSENRARGPEPAVRSSDLTEHDAVLTPEDERIAEAGHRFDDEFVGARHGVDRERDARCHRRHHGLNQHRNRVLVAVDAARLAVRTRLRRPRQQRRLRRRLQQRLRRRPSRNPRRRR